MRVHRGLGIPEIPILFHLQNSLVFAAGVKILWLSSPAPSAGQAEAEGEAESHGSRIFTEAAWRKLARPFCGKENRDAGKKTGFRRSDFDVRFLLAWTGPPGRPCGPS